MPVKTPEENRQINFMQKVINSVKEYTAEVAQYVKDNEDNSKDIQKSINEGNEENKKTFMNIFDSIKGVFKGLGSVIGDMKGYVQKVFSTFTGHLREVLGPVAEGFDAVKDVLTNTFNTMKGIWTKLFINTGVQQKVMSGLFSIFKRKEKTDARDAGKIKKSVVGLFGTLALAIGFAIGALFGIVGKPLMFVSKIFGGGVKVISTILKSLPVVGKFFKWMGAFIDVFKGKIGSIIAVMNKFPIIGKLLQGLKLGFKWLGWPLAIGLSLIDAIKAFASTNGDIATKFKAAFIAIFDSLFELPVKLFGWVASKVLGLFGIEVDAGQKVMDFFHFVIGKVTDTIADIFKDPAKYLGAIVDIVTGAFDTVVSGFKTFFDFAVKIPEMIDKGKEYILNTILGIFQNIGNFFSHIGSFVGELFSFKTLKDIVTGGLGDTVTEAWNKTKENLKIGENKSGIGNVINKNNKAKQEKEAAKAEQDKKYYKINKETGKIISDNAKNLSGGSSNTAIVPAGGSGSGRKEIVTENENGMLGLMNAMM